MPVQTPSTPNEHAEAATRDVFVGVALDLPVDTLFTYRVPAAMAARALAGARVRVRFRGKPMVGLVAEVSDRCSLARVLDVEQFPDSESAVEPGARGVRGARGSTVTGDGTLRPPELLALARWVARYYGCALGEAAAAMVPRGVRTRGKGAVRRRVTLARPAADAAKEADALPTERNAQARILRLLSKEADGVLVTDLLRRTKASQSPLRTLEKEGWIAVASESAAADPLVEASRRPTALGPPSEAIPTMNDAQARAVAALTEAVSRRAFAPFLLLGVTGSG